MTEEKKIAAVECRFAVHVPARGDTPDMHIVKEKVHYTDGTTAPRLRPIQNFLRPFWITQKNYQTYKQKKETEELSKLMRYDTTQSELRDRVANALGMGYSRDTLRKLGNSPYLYGTEITSTAIIKKQLQAKNKTHVTPYSVMMFDIETDMVHGTQDPIITTAVFGKEVYIAVTKGYIQGLSNVENHFREKCRELLSNLTLSKYEVEVNGKKQPVVLDINDYNITYEEANDTVDLLRKTFQWIHSHRPDLLAIWNMDFDIPKIIETLEKFGVDPAEVLCDPKIPRPLWMCKYKQGLKKKKKANGQEIPIDVADQWHSLLNTASFYVIDAMCTYRLLRLAKQKEPSYALDPTLEKELGCQKLKFDAAKGYVKDRWHIFMQSRHQIEYMVYAVFDSLSMKLLDDKLMDLSFTFPAYAGITDFAKANSKPKMIADALHFYAIEKHNEVMNSVGEQEEEYEDPEGEMDDDQDSETFGEQEEQENTKIMSLKDWIMTLPAHLVVPGLPLVSEDFRIFTKMRAFVYDSDCVSAYPTATSILNVSKATTKREIIEIKGIEERVFRLQNINLCSGYVNSLEYGHRMFGLPNLFELPELLDL